MACSEETSGRGSDDPAGPVPGEPPVDVHPGTSQALAEADEPWISPFAAVQAARQVVAAWVSAVNGDETALQALARPGAPAGGRDQGQEQDDGSEVTRQLLRPERRDWVISPGPEVAGLTLRGAGSGAGRLELRVEWRFTADQRYAGPVAPPGWLGPGDRDYVGSASVVRDDARPSRWRLADGAVRTADEFYGYKFTVRDETPGEFRTRAEADGPLASTGLPASTGLALSAASLVPSATYRLVAWFAEHDHKFIGEATADVARAAPPTREEARRLAEDAVDAEARQRVTLMYPGDDRVAEVRPALKVLRMVRLLAQAHPVEPAAGDDGPAVDDFARRYAASRGLAVAPERQPAGTDPGPWFLGTLDRGRSRGRMTGHVAGGRVGAVWYAQGARPGPAGGPDRWIVARYGLAPAARGGGLAVAVRRRRGVAGGPPRGLTEVPSGLTEVTDGGRPFRQRYLVAAAGGDPDGGGRSWAGRLLTDDFITWLLDQPYGDRGAAATCFQLQDGLLGVYAAGWPLTAAALDAFRERADRIASALERATRPAAA